MVTQEKAKSKPAFFFFPFILRRNKKNQSHRTVTAIGFHFLLTASQEAPVRASWRCLGRRLPAGCLWPLKPRRQELCVCRWRSRRLARAPGLRQPPRVLGAGLWACCRRPPRGSGLCARPARPCVWLVRARLPALSRPSLPRPLRAPRPPGRVGSPRQPAARASLLLVSARGSRLPAPLPTSQPASQSPRTLSLSSWPLPCFLFCCGPLLALTFSLPFLLRSVPAMG